MARPWSLSDDPAQAQAPPRCDESAAPTARGGLRVADILRADVPALYRALIADPFREDRVLRIAYRLFGWLEHHGRHLTKVVYCPPLPLLWSARRGDGGPATLIHKAYLRELWRERGPLERAVLLLSILLLWLPINLVAVSWATALNGAAVRRRSGKGIAAQVAEQVRLAAVNNILAPWYYSFDLHDARKRRQAAHYVHRFETKGGLYRLLKRPVAATLSPLQDKAAFAVRCRRHGVRTLPVLAACERGEVCDESGRLTQLPAVDLFCKPTCGRGGEGAERWDHVAPDLYRNGAGVALSTAALLAHLRKRSLERPYLLQPRARNHAATRDLSNGALATVRLLTCRSERGGHEATDAVFRMAVGANTVVDNFHAGGIAAAIDMATGTLGPATDMGLRPERGWCEVHPDTGARIAGRTLPYWPETLALAVRAHGAFPDRVIIGWDIAILDDGPCVIEGNGAPDLDIHQRCSGEPLGARRLGALLALAILQALAG